MIFSLTFGAFAFDDKGNGMRTESFGQFETWNMDVVQTERALARLAVEVDMSVMMVALALFLAQFVVEYATSVLKGMHHIMPKNKVSVRNMLDLSIDGIKVSMSPRLIGAE